MSTLDQQNTTNNGSSAINSTSAARYRATGFTVSHDGAVSQVDVYLKRNGTGGGDYTCKIYSDNGSGKLNTAISDGFTIDSSGVGTDLGWVTCTFSTQPNLTSGQKAHIVIYRTTDDGNSLSWGYSTGAAYAGDDLSTSSDGVNWTISTGYDGNFKEYYELATALRGNLLLLGVS